MGRLTISSAADELEDHGHPRATQAYTKVRNYASGKEPVAEKEGGVSMDHGETLTTKDMGARMKPEIPIDSDCEYRECTFGRSGVHLINLYKNIPSS